MFTFDETLFVSFWPNAGSQTLSLQYNLRQKNPFVTSLFVYVFFFFPFIGIFLHIFKLIKSRQIKISEISSWNFTTENKIWKSMTDFCLFVSQLNCEWIFKRTINVYKCNSNSFSLERKTELRFLFYLENRHLPIKKKRKIMKEWFVGLYHDFADFIGN